MEVDDEKQNNKTSVNNPNNGTSQDGEKESNKDKDEQKDKVEEKSEEDEEYEESEEEEESDDDIEIVLNADNMNLTNVGDASDLIKQRQKLANQSGQSLQPVQTSAPSTNNQILNSILTSIDKSSLKKIPDLDSIEDKPWTKPGVDISDYFNYGFTEETWRLYLHKQFQMRQEFQSQNKIKVLQTSTREDKPVEKKEDKRDDRDLERLAEKEMAEKQERERIEREKMERYERERYERERYERSQDFDRRRDSGQDRYRYRDRERDRYDRDRYDRSDYDRGREDYEYRGHRKKRSRSRDEYKVEESWESERKRRR